MSSYRYKLSLRVWHPSRDLNIVTDTLGLAPKFVDTAGKTRIRNGKLLDIVSRESYWSHEFALDHEVKQDIEDCLLKHLDLLVPYGTLFDNICSTGGRTEFFIGFFLESFNTGFVLSPQLQKKCATLNLGLAFDIYNNDKPSLGAV